MIHYANSVDRPISQTERQKSDYRELSCLYLFSLHDRIVKYRSDFFSMLNFQALHFFIYHIDARFISRRVVRSNATHASHRLSRHAIPRVSIADDSLSRLNPDSLSALPHFCVSGVPSVSTAARCQGHGDPNAPLRTRSRPRGLTRESHTIFRAAVIATITSRLLLSSLESRFS